MEFPVDDATLLSIEHALGGSLTFDRPADAADDDDEGPWLVGADYSLHTLLDFLAGCTGRDPNEEYMGHADGIPVYHDTRTHFSERDVIRALIQEVRALREAARVNGQD